MTTKAQRTEQAEAIERLREWLKPGDTVYTVLRHVSSSGMTRVIDIKKIDAKTEDGKEPRILTLGYNVANALGMKYDRDKEGVRIGGCGMDMGFALVYDLSRTLFPQGHDIHPEGHPGRTDGGYALTQRWL